MGGEGYDCGTCGRRHDRLPFAYAATAPAAWSRRVAGRERWQLGAEHCLVDGAHPLVRGVLRLPVLDAARDFEWGVWVSVAPGDFARLDALWEQPGREEEPPVAGRLASELPAYPRSTCGLAVQVHQRPVGLRPWVEVEPSPHPLSVEQREGMSLARVQAIAERLLHPGQPRSRAA